MQIEIPDELYALYLQSAERFGFSVEAEIQRFMAGYIGLCCQIDLLTQCLSRQELSWRIHRQLRNFEDGDGVYRETFLCIDIHNLKRFHDIYGHPAADEAIRKLAQAIVTIYPRENVYRWGGDEFAIVLGDRDPTVPKLNSDLVTHYCTIPQDELSELLVFKYSVVSVSVLKDRERLSNLLGKICLQIDRGMLESTASGTYILPGF